MHLHIRVAYTKCYKPVVFISNAKLRNFGPKIAIKCTKTCPYLTQNKFLTTGHHNHCARKFQDVLDVLTAHQRHHDLWNKSPFRPILNKHTYSLEQALERPWLQVLAWVWASYS